MFIVSGFLGWLALVVWRNDQKPIRPVRRKAVQEQVGSDPPSK